MSSTNTVNFAGIPDYTALAQAYGYGNPQFAIPAQQRKSSGLSNAVKAGVVGTVGAGAAIWGFNPSYLTPVDKNGNLFSEYLYALEDTAKLQKGFEEAGFSAAKTALNGKINVATLEDYYAVREFVKTGKIPEKATDVQKALFSDLLKTKREGLYNEIKTAVNSLHGRDFKTEKLPKINEILKQHGIADVADNIAYEKLLNALQKGEGTAYTDALKESLAKDYHKVIGEAATAEQKAIEEVAFGLKGAEKASIVSAESNLAFLRDRKNFFEAMPDSKDGILKWLKEQPSYKKQLDALKGEKLTALNGDLEKIATDLLGRRTELLGTSEKGLAQQITKQEGVVKEIKEGLQKKFGSFFDSSRGTLKNGAPDKLAKAFKGFKWGTIAKRAGIIGGIAALGGWLLLKEA